MAYGPQFAAHLFQQSGVAGFGSPDELPGQGKPIGGHSSEPVRLGTDQKGNQDKESDDQKGYPQSLRPGQKRGSSMRRGNLKEDQRHACREIIGRLILINMKICDPEQGRSIDGQAQDHIPDRQPGSSCHGQIDHKSNQHAAGLFLHTAETQVRQSREGRDHRIVHSEVPPGHQKNQCGHHSRGNGCFCSFL